MPETFVSYLMYLVGRLGPGDLTEESEIAIRGLHAAYDATAKDHAAMEINVR